MRGGLIAGSLFVLPGFVVMMALSILYAVYGQVGWVAGLLFGLQAAVVAIVVQALIRVAGRTLHTPFLRIVAAVAFVALFFFAVPFPIVIIAAGLVGWAIGRWRQRWLPSLTDDDAEPAAAGERALLSDDERVPVPAARRALRTAVVCLIAWLTPVVLLLLTLGSDNIFTQQALLFSKTAVVTFGGAYAVLAYVSQEAVQTYGWITAQDMTTGLGLAETTPGPLIMVVQFVGFLAAYNHPGELPPLLAGVLGALITVWVTFVPCFMFIFAGAPYVDRLRHNRGLHHALSRDRGGRGRGHRQPRPVVRAVHVLHGAVPRRRSVVAHRARPGDARPGRRGHRAAGRTARVRPAVADAAGAGGVRRCRGSRGPARCDLRRTVWGWESVRSGWVLRCWPSWLPRPRRRRIRWTGSSTS